MPTSPTSGPGGSGSTYTPPTSRLDFGGGTLVSIADGGTGLLDWHNALGPDFALVDLTAPTIPVIPTAGIYQVAVTAQGQTLTAAGYFQLALELDSDGLDASTDCDSRPASAAKPSPYAALSGTLYIPASGTLRARVHSYDGVAARDFAITEAYVQRIT